MSFPFPLILQLLNLNADLYTRLWFLKRWRRGSWSRCTKEGTPSSYLPGTRWWVTLLRLGLYYVLTVHRLAF
jgi:hypothetical protein